VYRKVGDAVEAGAAVSGHIKRLVIVSNPTFQKENLTIDKAGVMKPTPFITMLLVLKIVLWHFPSSGHRFLSSVLLILAVCLHVCLSGLWYIDLTC
jgi:hypothetical protein